MVGLGLIFCVLIFISQDFEFDFNVGFSPEPASLPIAIQYGGQTEIELGKLVLQNNADNLRQQMSQFNLEQINTVYQGMTPLMIASSLGNSETVELLLNGGADPNRRGAQDRTSLQYAVEKNHIDVARLLLQVGADINGVDVTRLTPLVMAVDRDYDQLAYYLIQQGADPNIQHVAGHTALIDAARNGDMAMVEALLEAGANPMLALPDGRRASDIAEQLQHYEIADLLIELEES